MTRGAGAQAFTSAARRAIATCAFAAAVAVPVAAQTVRGRVVDAATRAGLSGVGVRVVTADSLPVASGLTGDDGAFTILAPAGEYLVAMDRLGYESPLVGPLRLRAGGFVDVTLAMTSVAIPLDSVRVAVEREPQLRALQQTGFYERRKQGYGRLLERSDFPKGDLRTAADIFERMPGVRLFRGNGNAEIQFRGALRLGPGSARVCQPLTFMDGALMGRFNLEALVADEVEAVEVYSPGLVPTTFSPTADGCGAIVIWTRKGLERNR
jgi:hypothetical protein